MTSLCANIAAPNFDDVTLCKHVTAEEIAFIVFNSFPYRKNTSFERLILLSFRFYFNYEFAIRYWVLCDEMGKIWMMVIQENIMLVA